LGQGIESFGANAQGLMRSIGDVEVVMDGTKEAYFELRFEELLDTYERAGVMLDRIEGQALDLKDRSLLWVYVIEWLGVTGTALFAGFVLWTIMVRRRLYREASATRLTLSAVYPR